MVKHFPQISLPHLFTNIATLFLGKGAKKCEGLLQNWEWQKSESEQSQQQKFVLPLTFSEYLCQLPIDLSTVTIRQWSTERLKSISEVRIICV